MLHQPIVESSDDEERGSHSAVVMAVGRAMAQWLGDIVMPPLCLTCREPLATRDALCPACWQTIEFIRPPLCDRLGLPMPYATGGVMISAAAAANPPPYGRARAVARFGGAMRGLIHDFKFHDRHDARRLFGRWLVEAGADLLAEADLVVPVPLGRWRLLGRRFNQAALIAREVATLANVPFEPQILHRTRRTKRQVGLSASQRRANVAAAFGVDERHRAIIEGRRIVLVDDVITTGATVEACTRTLNRAGAGNVDVLALAMVTDPRTIEA